MLRILIQICRLNPGLVTSNVNNEHLTWRPPYIYINTSRLAKHVRDTQLSERPKKQLMIFSFTCSCLRGRRNSLISYLWHAAVWEAKETVEDLVFDMQLSEKPKKQLKILSLTYNCLRGRRNSWRSYLWHAVVWEAEKTVEDLIFDIQLSERPKKQLKILSLTCICLRGQRNSWRSYLWHAIVWETEEIFEVLIFGHITSNCILRHSVQNAYRPTEDVLCSFLPSFVSLIPQV